MLPSARRTAANRPFLVYDITLDRPIVL